MATTGKLSGKSQRTLVNTDVIPIQDGTSYNWYKTTLAKLKEFIYTLIFSDDNTWTGDNTFSGAVNVPSGSTPTNAVNKSQLDTKEDASTGTDGNYIKKGIPNSTGLLSDSTTLNAINLPELSSPPTDSNDTIGADGDIGYFSSDLYLKSKGKWYKIEGIIF